MIRTRQDRAKGSPAPDWAGQDEIIANARSRRESAYDVLK
ncbi:hypothetical protein ALP36_05068 [Pseudomonas syringae pv. coriandricola]|uniref:Uncharacterized protein n=2 Tax=Pseudomonas syringae group genomosp. 3 TaxID=251701 RepID=A0A3M4TK91_9PSED|nr:Uncharacterized protein ALO84_05293 [Pseudomonas syringae pv. maculicola]RMP41997.1 hypothetical protein ALQ24_05069 [Pseudomonas syringae pv. antirrhini]RMR27624.1 hypothetical protein ALP87_05469 [Pseudomonas syringae pv. coriandricola]RMU11909.1 hypothetical protein ALP36_05068 [Pseudomonas syringae pv. coriandricola]RMV32350.1 hypothetical protein ALP13_04921 [Pseudomonas syringae pv. maculicola]